MTLTIIICTNNRYGLLEKALASAIAQGNAANEIIVVDNSPNKEEAKGFARRYCSTPKIRFAFEEIQNLSHARNVGVALAKADIVAFLDDDAIAEPGWAKALAESFASDGRNVGCVGGPVKPIWASSPPYWLTPTLAGYLSILDWGSKKKELGAGEWLVGCNIAFHRQALLDVGGFRTDIGRTGNPLCLMSNEETAAWLKLKHAGKKVLYSPHAIVFHHIDKNRANAQWLSRRVAWQAVSDAISDPQYARDVANSALQFKATQKLFVAITSLRRNIKRQSSFGDEDAKALHALVVALLCNGIGNPSL